MRGRRTNAGREAVEVLGETPGPRRLEVVDLPGDLTAETSISAVPDQQNGSEAAKPAAPSAHKSRALPIGNGHSGRTRRGREIAQDPAAARAELVRAQAQLAALEANEVQLRSEIDRLAAKDARTNTLERSVRSLGDDLGNALVERSAAELRAEQAEQTAATLNDNLQHATSQRARLAEALAALHFELEAAEARAKDAAVALAAAAAQLAEASAQRDELAGERFVLLGERDQLAAERSLLLAERDGLAAERQVLLGERDGLAAERRRVSGALASTQEELASTKEAVAETRMRVGALSAERDQAQVDLANLREDLERSQSNWDGERAKFGAELSRIGAEYARALARLAAAEIRAEQMKSPLPNQPETSRQFERLLNRARNLFPPDHPPASDPIDLIDQIRRRLRELERAVDSAEAQRDQIRAEMEARIQTRSSHQLSRIANVAFGWARRSRFFTYGAAKR